MARLIVKSPCYKCGGNTFLSGCLRYIATRERVGRIVDEIERLSSVRGCYNQWLILQGEVDEYYHDKKQMRVPL